MIFSVQQFYQISLVHQPKALKHFHLQVIQIQDKKSAESD